MSLAAIKDSGQGALAMLFLAYSCKSAEEARDGRQEVPMFEWLLARIAAVSGTDVAQERGWKFLLHPPAMEEEVRECERVLGQPLPASYGAFLLRWDGASLFRSEHRRPDGQVGLSSDVGVAGTRRLPDLNHQLRAELPLDVLPNEWRRLIVCCETPSGTGDHAALNAERQTAVGEFAIVDCFHESRARCWRRRGPVLLGQHAGAARALPAMS